MSALDMLLALAMTAAAVAAFVLADRRNQRTSREYANQRTREIAGFQRHAEDDQGAAGSAVELNAAACRHLAALLTAKADDLDATASEIITAGGDVQVGGLVLQEGGR